MGEAKNKFQHIDDIPTLLRAGQDVLNALPPRGLRDLLGLCRTQLDWYSQYATLLRRERHMLGYQWKQLITAIIEQIESSDATYEYIDSLELDPDVKQTLLPMVCVPELKRAIRDNAHTIELEKLNEARATQGAVAADS